MSVRVLAVSATVFLMLLGGCEKARLDDELRRMCDTDGGVRIYERVALKASDFDNDGLVNFFRPTKGEDALGPDYRFFEDRKYFRQGNPEMWRTHYRVVRTRDGKLLGEAVVYVRRGGDMPSLMHDSSLVCPDNSGGGTLVRRIFVVE